jgi:hypothetical protein
MRFQIVAPLVAIVVSCSIMATTAENVRAISRSTDPSLQGNDQRRNQKTNKTDSRAPSVMKTDKTGSKAPSAMKPKGDRKAPSAMKQKSTKSGTPTIKEPTISAPAVDCVKKGKNKKGSNKSSSSKKDKLDREEKIKSVKGTASKSEKRSGKGRKSKKEKNGAECLERPEEAPDRTPSLPGTRGIDAQQDALQVASGGGGVDPRSMASWSGSIAGLVALGLL